MAASSGRASLGAQPPGVVPALALFAAIRLTGVTVLALLAALTGRPPLKSLAHSWDSVWYLHIAKHGYGTRIHISATGALQRDWAFFPLYPVLIRVLSRVLHVGPGAAALLIAWCAAALAAYGIYAIGHRLHGRAVATVLVALWAALPHSVVLSLAYTEPLFSALAAWSLYAVLKGRWMAAGALAALAGLTRPSGIAAAVAVVTAAGCEAVRRRGRVPPGLWAGALLAPLGWAGYVLWVGQQSGDLLHGYFQAQSAWNSRLDLGAGTLRFLKALLLHGGGAVQPLALVIVAASLVLFLLLCLDRGPLPLVVFAGVLLAMVITVSGPFSSKPRFLLPAFPLLLPMACGLVRAWRTGPKQAALVGGSVAAMSLVYGAYLVLIARQPL
ncbi:mannosyltransferase family protein [Streptomyces sp. NPDC007905]|uniref:mannosyltransferase family protein n=1 Tax=Streptomyces sp. NPDC007905 TaxID=3364788 RepID=UPI0036EB0B4F